MSQQHFVVGYGSLMSHDSRFRFSQINTRVQPVWVNGWERGWVTSCAKERFNSVGAYPNPNAKLNATLVPVSTITPELQQREQNYRFTEVPHQVISLTQAPTTEADVLSETNRYWICETLQQTQPDAAHPLLQSYIDTCLAGCVESGGLTFARSFIETTQFWHSNVQSEFWINDRKHIKYPRAAQVTSEQAANFDELLQEFDLLGLRTE